MKSQQPTIPPAPLRPLHPAVVVGSLAALAACGPYPAPPETRVDTVVDTLHGVVFEDDYRWLEDQTSPETRQWIREQNAYAEEVVGPSAIRDTFRRRLTELTDAKGAR